MKRVFDFAMALIASIVLFVPFCLIYVLVKITSPGPAIYWSKRVGKNNRHFLMPKFRTMKIDTPQLPTHLMKDPKNYLTSIGPFLRKTSLDEIPQLWSILRGEMSFVGPRPALYNQDDLIELRNQKGVSSLVPGLTGWAQINGRDTIPDSLKVELDHQYLIRRSFFFDIKIIFLTLIKVIKREHIAH